MRMSYDYGLKQQVIKSRDPSIVEKYGGKISSARNWLYRGVPEVIASDDLAVTSDPKIRALEKKIEKLEKENDLYKANANLFIEVNEIIKINLAGRHIRDKKIRTKVLEVVDRYSPFLGVKNAREQIGISQARLNRWRVADKVCLATGTGTCAKRHPNQLPFKDVETIKRLLTSPDYSHFPIKSLHYYAKRKNLVYCCLGTWYKYRDVLGIERPKGKKRKKKYSGKISAYRVNQYWHVDVSYIEIRTGRVYYLQLVLDGLSRHIISWQLNNEISGANTKKLLKLARARAKRLHPNFGADPKKMTSVVTDGGSENDCNIVRSYLEDPIFGLVIARQHVDFPNILIECFFRSLKNNYLYLQNITSRKELVEMLEFYIRQYNNLIPHGAFFEATPREMYLNQWSSAGELDLKEKSVQYCKTAEREK